MSVAASKQKSWASLGLLFAATSWGIIWYPYRLLADAGIAGIQSNFATYVVALFIGCIFFARQLWRDHSLSLAAIGIGLASGWANISYVLAVLQGEVMRVLLLFYLAPLWTLLLAHFLLDEPSGQQELLVMGLAVVGMLTMLWQGMDSLPIPQTHAEWLALSAGFSFALSIVLTRRAEHLTLASKSLAVWLGVCVICLVFLSVQNAPLGSLQNASPTQWALILGIGTLLFFVTFIVQFGLSHTPANRAAIIFMFELVAGAISSYFLAHEVMSMREWIGGSMIIAAAMFEANKVSQ